jgi:hypothetical protein
MNILRSGNQGSDTPSRTLNQREVRPLQYYCRLMPEVSGTCSTFFKKNIRNLSTIQTFFITNTVSDQLTQIRKETVFAPDNPDAGSKQFQTKICLLNYGMIMNNSSRQNSTDGSGRYPVNTPGRTCRGTTDMHPESGRPGGNGAGTIEDPSLPGIRHTGVKAGTRLSPG